MEKNKRALKKAFTQKNKRELSLQKVAMLALMISAFVFVTTQLATNAKLSPLGHKLASLNTEKNLLLEENRELEQDIARNRSLTIINKYSSEKLGLKKTDNNKTIYVNSSDVQASN